MRSSYRGMPFPAPESDQTGLTHRKQRANLSTDYFTNRQDRYHVFSCPHLTDYYEQIHNAICSISYKVLPGPPEVGGYIMDWPESNPAPSPVKEPERYKAAAALLLDPLIQPAEMCLSTEAKTVVYPVGQFTPVLKSDTSTEHPAVSTVLSMLAQKDAEGSQWCFTAGYFNIHPGLKELLLKSRSTGIVVTAAPEANGFYGSKGVSNMLPSAYTLLSRRFLQDVLKFGKEKSIELKEWKKGVHGQDPNAWTYHAKGLYTSVHRKIIS
jgi:CDP-diacylglycerol--glycerol-3-phosphate 3-phosphatidyltransferase